MIATLTVILRLNKHGLLPNETALSELKKSHSKLPNSKDILAELDKLQEEKNTLMQKYSSSKSTMDELYQIRKNYGIYMGKEMVR